MPYMNWRKSNYFIHNQKCFAQNQTYPVEQQSPPIVHIKMIANVCVKRKSNEKYIVFKKKYRQRFYNSSFVMSSFKCIDELINVYWFSSLNTALIIVWNQLYQSHKSSSSAISHEPVVIFCILGEPKYNTD